MNLDKQRESTPILSAILAENKIEPKQRMLAQLRPILLDEAMDRISPKLESDMLTAEDIEVELEKLPDLQYPNDLKIKLVEWVANNNWKLIVEVMQS